MFENPVLDILSRVHYTVPLLIYVPVVLFFLYQTFFVYSLNVLYALLLVMAGLALWTFTEYNLHRFFFHWMPPGKIGEKVNFILHGVHHAYPRDSMRLVMVPAISIPLALGFYFIFVTLFGQAYTAPLFSGLVTGYLFYDMTHYAVHHANLRSPFWLELKQHHMAHHYNDSDHGYGVTTKFWDIVFRTTIKKKAANPITVVKHESVSSNS